MMCAKFSRRRTQTSPWLLLFKQKTLTVYTVYTHLNNKNQFHTSAQPELFVTEKKGKRCPSEVHGIITD